MFQKCEDALKRKEEKQSKMLKREEQLKSAFHIKQEEETPTQQQTKAEKQEILAARRAEKRELAQQIRQENLTTTGQVSLLDRAHYDQVAQKNEHEKILLLHQMKEMQMQHLQQLQEVKIKTTLEVKKAAYGDSKRSNLLEDQEYWAYLSTGVLKDIGQLHNDKLFPIYSAEEITQMEHDYTQYFGKPTRYCRTLRNLAREEFENAPSDYISNKLDDVSDPDPKVIVYDFWLVDEDYIVPPQKKQVQKPGRFYLDSRPLYTEEEMCRLYTREERIILYDENMKLQNPPTTEDPAYQVHVKAREQIRTSYKRKREELESKIELEESSEPKKKMRKIEMKKKIEAEMQEDLHKEMMNPEGWYIKNLPSPQVTLTMNKYLYCARSDCGNYLPENTTGPTFCCAECREKPF